MDKTKISQNAIKYVQKGQYEKAIAEYRKIIEKDPKDVRSLLKIGELQQKKGDNEAASTTLLDVANSYATEGFFLKAVAVFKQVLKLAPQRVDVILRLADLYKQLGLMSEAMAQLHAAAAHYEKSGAMQESVEILRRLISMEPDNVAARLRLADVLVRQGATDEALSELRTTAAKLRGSSRLEDYLRVADRIVVLDGKDDVLGRELAHAYLAKGDVRRALERLQVCFQHEPKNPETLELLARAFVGVGQRAKAASVYKELARVHAERARGADEQACWRKVLELAPDDAEARQFLGAAAQVAHVAPQAIGGARPPAPPRLGQSPGPAAPPFVAARQEPSFPGARDAHLQSGGAWVGPSPEAARPEGSRPGIVAPRLEGSRSGVAPHSEGSRPVVVPRPEGSRPGVASRPTGSPPVVAPRPEASRSGAAAGHDGSRPSESGEPAPLAKLLTETDVFVKYGLTDKAGLHLQKIFAIDPDCIPAHEKAVELLRTRDPARQLASLAALARLYVRSGEIERGRPHFDELRILDPGHAELRSLAPIYDGGGAPEEIADDLILDGTPGPIGFDALPDEELVALPLQDEPLLLPLDADEEAVELDVEGVPEVGPPSFQPVGDDALFALATDPHADEVVDEPLLFDPSLGPIAGAQQEALRSFAQDAPPREHTVDIELEAPRAEQTIDLVVGDDEEATVAAPGADPFAADRTELALIDVEEGYEPTEIAPDDAFDRTPAYAAEETREVNFDAVTAARESPMIGDEFERATPGWRSEEGLVPEPTPAPVQDPVNPWRVGAGELDEMAGELDEAAFYLQQGLLDEAEEIYRSVERRVPGHAQAVGRLMEIAARRGEQTGAPAPESTVYDRAAFGSAGEFVSQPLATPSDDGLDGELFDLGAALAEEIADSVPDPEPSASFQYSAEDVLRDFRAGVARTVRPEDVDTHYNLAIAYKEMGLLSDAIAAFEQALSGCEGDARAVDCLTMIGMCHTMQGQHLHAVRAYSRGLEKAGLTLDTEKALHYEIGLAYEAAGDKNEALTSFGRAARLDGSYREVRATIARLVAEGAVPRTPGPSAGPDAPAAAMRTGSS